MKVNDNDVLIKVETNQTKTDSTKIHRKMMNKTSMTFKKVMMDKLSGKLGEC